MISILWQHVCCFDFVGKIKNCMVMGKCFYFMMERPQTPKHLRSGWSHTTLGACFIFFWNLKTLNDLSRGTQASVTENKQTKKQKTNGRPLRILLTPEN
jgi:hypothetical protein